MTNLLRDYKNKVYFSDYAPYCLHNEVKTLAFQAKPLDQPPEEGLNSRLEKNYSRSEFNGKLQEVAHCTYDIKYYIEWITKYRKPVITGKIAERTRELIRGICQQNEVEILAGHLSKDHIHLLISVPPHLSASKLVQVPKGL